MRGGNRAPARSTIGDSAGKIYKFVMKPIVHCGVITCRLVFDGAHEVLG
jgi:hypothetical protein